MKKAIYGLCIFFSCMLLLHTANVVYAEEVTLYANFSMGSPTAAEHNLIKTKKVQMENVDVAALAKALSEWSGLDFTINEATVTPQAITVDWSAKSTLIANLDDRKQKEDFHFFDVDSMRWFMLDSLYDTIAKNFKDVPVHYTMDGGKELKFEALTIMNVFPKNIPFMGSAFYEAHSDLKGDD